MHRLECFPALSSFPGQRSSTMPDVDAWETGSCPLPLRPAPLGPRGGSHPALRRDVQISTAKWRVCSSILLSNSAIRSSYWAISNDVGTVKNFSNFFFCSWVYSSTLLRGRDRRPLARRTAPLLYRSLPLPARSPYSLSPCQFIDSVLPTNHLFSHYGP